MTNVQSTIPSLSDPRIQFMLNPITGNLKLSPPLPHHMEAQPSCAVCGSHEVMRYVFVSYDNVNSSWQPVEEAGRAVCNICEDVTDLVFRKFSQGKRP